MSVCVIFSCCLLIYFSFLTPDRDWETDYRFKELQKWVLANDPNGDYHIYGKWDPEVLKKYPSFKGMLSNEKVDELFEDTKYTLIVPIWIVTGKHPFL